MKKIMVKRHSTWLSKVDANGITIRMWAYQFDGEHVKQVFPL